jgi:hypothetical protein
MVSFIIDWERDLHSESTNLELNSKLYNSILKNAILLTGDRFLPSLLKEKNTLHLDPIYPDLLITAARIGDFSSIKIILNHAGDGKKIDLLKEMGWDLIGIPLASDSDLRSCNSFLREKYIEEMFDLVHPVFKEISPLSYCSPLYYHLSYPRFFGYSQRKNRRRLQLRQLEIECHQRIAKKLMAIGSNLDRKEYREMIELANRLYNYDTNTSLELEDKKFRENRIAMIYACYQEAPMMRHKEQLLLAWPQKLYSLMLLHDGNFLELKPINKENQKLNRFFAIAKKLPEELKAVMSNRAFHSPREYIPATEITCHLKSYLE